MGLRIWFYLGTTVGKDDTIVSFAYYCLKTAARNTEQPLFLPISIKSLIV